MLRMLPLLAEILTEDIGAAVRRKRRNAILYAVAGLLFLTAYVSALAAAGVYLADLASPLEAALAISAIMAATGVLVLVAIAVLKAVDGKRAALAAETKRPVMAATLAATVLPTVLRSPGLVTLAGIAGAAFFVLKGMNTRPGDNGRQQA
ncbi:MAG: hypothetical protein R3D02_10265 [Hyphomicrobiales bacterium]